MTFPSYCAAADTKGTRITGAVCERFCQHETRTGPLLGCESDGVMMTCFRGCLVGRTPEGLVPPAPARGDVLGAWLADASHTEAASIDAFHALRDELIVHGAPAELVAASERASRDEISHARTTARLARRFGAEEGPWSQKPRVDRPAARALEAIAIENAVEGCVNETFSALVNLWQAEHAKETRVGNAMRAIARDEIRHAALAWSVAEWIGTRLDAPARERVESARRAAVAKLATALAQTEIPSELVDRGGLPDRAASSRLVAALDSVLWQATAAA